MKTIKTNGIRRNGERGEMGEKRPNRDFFSLSPTSPFLLKRL
jgi:hypothetical protein